MMTKTVRIINLVAIACLVSGITFAKEKAQKADEGAAKATTIEDLAVVRTRVQMLVQDLRPLVNYDSSGCRQKGHDISYAYTKINQMLATAIREEQAKPAEVRNKILIEDCVRMQQYIADRWNKYNSKERPVLDRNSNEINGLFSQISPVVANLKAVDIPYNKLNLDLGLLKAVYVAVEARGNELKAQAKVVVDGFGNLAAKWDEDLKIVAKLTGQKID